MDKNFPLPLFILVESEIRDGRKSGSGINIPGSATLFFLILPFCRAKPKRNTETFQPSHEPTEMRLIAVPSGLARYNREILTRDVIMVPELFCKPADLAIYDKVRKREGRDTKYGN
jgi:hypothetical protein